MQPPDLTAERDLACGVETDEVEDVLADVDADRGKRWRRGIHELLLLFIAGHSLCRLTRRGKQPVHPISGHFLRLN